MTDIPNDPPDTVAAVDPLDERLSAALDGPSDPTASDPTASEPEADPVADERVLERSRALEAARDLLAVPPPPLDDLTRRRLLHTAVAQRYQPERQYPRWFAGTAAAAAAAVLVVLAGWTVTRLDRHSARQADTKSATAGTTAPSNAPLDLREVSDPAVLRKRVEAALREPSRTVAPKEVAPGSSLGADAAGPESRCLATVRAPAGATPGVLGRATFHGAAAVVFVARDGSRTLIIVLASSDCRLLSSQFIAH